MGHRPQANHKRATTFRSTASGDCEDKGKLLEVSSAFWDIEAGGSLVQPILVLRVGELFFAICLGVWFSSDAVDAVEPCCYISLCLLREVAGLFAAITLPRC